MIYPLYSVRDLKGDFWSVHVEQNEAAAIRNFSMMINTGNSLMNYAPKDFELYHVGFFNSVSGLIEANSLPQLIVRGSDMIGGFHEES